MSRDDALRTAIRLALAQWSVVPLTHLGYIADAVLALSEVAALRAKAAAADRVREMLAAEPDIQPLWDFERGALRGIEMTKEAVRRALADDRTDRGRC